MKIVVVEKKFKIKIKINVILLLLPREKVNRSPSNHILNDINLYVTENTNPCNKTVLHKKFRDFSLNLMEKYLVL